jgi:hypothetical protein
MAQENRAVATLRRYIDAAFARDWDSLADILADAYRMEDRRTGLKNSYDKAGDVERSRATVDVGFDHAVVDIVELRGEDCALLRGSLRATEADYAVETLLVVRVDDDERLIETYLFEGDELEAARAQFDSMAPRG